MDDIAQIRADDDQQQGYQNLGALGGHDPRHVGEHADGRQADDEAHQLFNDGVGGGDKVTAQLCPLSGGQDGAA